MEGACGVPARTGGELAALAQCHVAPAEPREVIQHAATDDAAADDEHLHVALHGFIFPTLSFENPAGPSAAACLSSGRRLRRRGAILSRASYFFRRHTARGAPASRGATGVRGKDGRLPRSDPPPVPVAHGPPPPHALCPCPF